LLRQHARLFRAVTPVLDVVEQVRGHGEPLLTLGANGK
jgi:hypothetical protein